MIVSQLAEELIDDHYNVLFISNYSNFAQINIFADKRVEFRGEKGFKLIHPDFSNHFDFVEIDDCETLSVDYIYHLIKSNGVDRVILDIDAEHVALSTLEYMESMCEDDGLDVELISFIPESVSSEVHYRNDATLRLESRSLDTTDRSRAQVATVVHNRKESEDYYLIRPFFAFVQEEI